MVFISRLKFSGNYLIIKACTVDPENNKIAITDLKNNISFFDLSSWQLYFNNYRDIFQKNLIFSQEEISAPKKKGEINLSNSPEIIKLRFSPTKFALKQKVTSSMKKCESEDNLDNSFVLKSKKGRNISVSYEKKSSVDKIIADDYIIAVGFESGEISLFGRITNERISFFEDEKEKWEKLLQIKDSNYLSVVDIEWSKHSNELVAIYFNNVLVVWNINYENNNFFTEKLHAIYLQCSTFLKQINVIEEFENAFFLSAKEVCYFIRIEKKKIFLNGLLELNNLKEEEYEKDFYLEHKNGISSCGRFLLIPKKKENVGLYFLEWDETNKRMNIKKKTDLSKGTYCDFSKFLYFKSNSQILKKKINAAEAQNLLMIITEKKLSICTLTSKKFQEIFVIEDFKTELNSGIWLNPYTILVFDDEGKAWFIKFNGAELGYVVK